MEGGGERKRKGVPIALDWDWLMPPGAKDDEVPPELVIENAAEKSKPREELMMEYEEEPHRDHYLEKMSDKELIEKFHRVKSSLGTMSSRLPDGGEKLRANLKSTEAEMERRKLLKVGDKSKKAIPLDDESTLTGVSPDLSPRGAPLPVPRPQSTFGLHFCNNLDKRATEPFGEELSTLDCSNHKNMREKNRPYLTQRTHRTGLSSRQAPFKSPRHLSVNIDDLPQSNGELSVSYSSATSPQQFDKDLPGYFRKKETAPHSQPILNSRRNKRKTVVLVDEEELEVYEIDHADQVGRSSKEARIYYPSRDDPEAIEICYSDLECLTPESYLSSNIMNFYIRYLQKPTSPSARKRDDCHFFNTYFYKKLKEDVLTKIDKETSFVKFRRWWKGVDIFEKTYIFLPIHENLHWSLVIICIPSKEENSGPVILHLDSLGLHTSKSIFNDVKSFIIQEWKFLKQEKVLPELSIADNIWDKLSRRIEEKVVKVPQQRNEYDCGLFVLCFIERFIEEAPNRLKEGDLTMFGKEWFRPEEASSLRRKISSLLREEFKNANEGTCKSDP